LRLNLNKGEYIECGPQMIQIGGEDVNEVEQFKYLGFLISSDGKTLTAKRVPMQH
jgi:hypothetical protein